MGFLNKIKDTVSSFINLDDTMAYEDINSFPDDFVENIYDNKDTAKKKNSLPNFVGMKNNKQNNYNNMNNNIPNANNNFNNMNNSVFNNTKQNVFPNQPFTNANMQNNIQNPFQNLNGMNNIPNTMPNGVPNSIPNNMPNNMSNNMMNNMSHMNNGVLDANKNLNYNNNYMQNANWNDKNVYPSNVRAENKYGEKKDNVQLFNPKVYEDVQTIANFIKNGGTALISIEGITYDLSLRIIDFLTGLMYAYDGNIKEVQNNMYIASFTEVLDQGFKNINNNNIKTNLSNGGSIFNTTNPFAQFNLNNSSNTNNNNTFNNI